MSKTCTAAACDRLRLSAWVIPQLFWKHTGVDARGNPILVPFKGSIEDVFDTDAFVKTAVIDSSHPSGAVQQGKLRVIDDISLLKTVIHGPRITRDSQDRVISVPGMTEIGWDNPFGLPMSDANLQDFYTRIINHCHEELGTQCLLGYSVVQDAPQNPRHDAFYEWLNMEVPDPSISDVVLAIMTFCDKNLPTYDGFSFDVEGLDKRGIIDKHLSDANETVMKRNLAKFYQDLARAIVTTTGDQFLAFAAGGMVSETHVIDPPENNGVPIDDPATPRSARLHSYDIAIGHHNLIVRPMAYDATLAAPKSHNRRGWHRKIVEFVDKIGLDKRQFQLGIKTGTGNPGDDAAFANNVSEIARSCRDLRDEGRVGLAVFKTDSTLWATCNHNLNFRSARAAGRIGQPHQFRHNTETFPRVDQPKFKSPALVLS